MPANMELQRMTALPRFARAGVRAEHQDVSRTECALYELG
jgi:hypothetical protein